VIDNVALPLRAAGVAKRERHARALSSLVTVNLEHTADQHPWQLSGGMQQRVALARALVNEPEILLMDEPFASVDAQTRFDLEDLTLRIRAERGVAIVLVTHDIDESVYLGDQVLALAGSPARIVDVIDVPLGAARDQLTTRADHRFAELRTSVLAHLRGALVPA
jgi:NitT/TauT family transport system ATP-binding protein